MSDYQTIAKDFVEHLAKVRTAGVTLYKQAGTSG